MEPLTLQGIDLEKEIKDHEINRIKEALCIDQTVAGAARLLRLKRTTLWEKIRRFEIFESKTDENREGIPQRNRYVLRNKAEHGRE